MNLNQIDLIKAISDEIIRQAKAARKKDVRLVPRQFKAIVDAANTVVRELGKDFIPATDGIGVRAWLGTDDTGLSSEYMAHKLFDIGHRNYNYPHDYDDFGRCYRLLQAVTASELETAENRWKSLADGGPQWKWLVENWNKCFDLYASHTPDSLRVLNEYMHKLSSLK